MALREFEPIIAKYYPKIKDSIKHGDKPISFNCAVMLPTETTRIKIVKGFITSTTKSVIYTTDKIVDFKVGSIVEYGDKKLKITNLVIDESDTNMLGAMKFKSNANTKNLPKWMTLE